MVYILLIVNTVPPSEAIVIGPDGETPFPNIILGVFLG